MASLEQHRLAASLAQRVLPEVLAEPPEAQPELELLAEQPVLEHPVPLAEPPELPVEQLEPLAYPLHLPAAYPLEHPEPLGLVPAPLFEQQVVPPSPLSTPQVQCILDLSRSPAQ